MSGARLTMTLTDTHLQDIVTAAVAEATRELTQSVNELHVSVADMRDQLTFGDQRMATIEGDLKKNSLETSATRDASAEMLEAFNFAKRGIRVIGWIGSVIGWVITKAWPVWGPIAAYFGWKGIGK